MTTATKSSMTAWERWELASFDEATARDKPKVAADAVPPAPTFSAEEIAALREAARNEGYAAGQKEGFDTGYADGKAKGEASADEQGRVAAKALIAATDRFEQQVEALDAAVADELVALATEIARRVIQQSVATRPETIVAVVREALGQLSVQHASIHLHPEDASLVRSYSGEQLGHAGHRIHEDSKLARGDVVIESGGSHLDATLATRWRRVIESLGQDTPWIDASTS
jgi:flagellar assembly protein FliH